ncbi:response regulator [Rhodoferax sp. BAB1]|uniref:response regulator n=1 Tax=Rhodoferax sp. BAB1 TaxID=2741720 RepID=UPI0015771788|nr:response regulator [Rhodoferax sp. BAB1]QKO20864.1 response regulator [Rhodoferax sp. BAB1]
MSLRVLVVEDDREIRTLVQSALAVEGFEVQTAVTLSEATALVQHSPPDLIVLDLGLPDGEGLQLVREVRRQSSLPIVVVSARHQEEQKIVLLDAGADDYLTKPFSVAELLARMRVALRHRGTALAAAVTEHVLDDLRIDLATRTVTRDGQPVHLTPTEFKLLACLVRSAGRVVTHRQLLADVWGPEYTEHTHYLRLYMGQLRAKIERDPAEPRHLLTETGVGYRLAGD